MRPWWRAGDGCSGFCRRKFFFLLALSGRAICNLGFVERPVVIGIFWWLFTGEPSPALPLALFFELFWLDLYPIGSYVPPMPSFPFLVLLSLSRAFGWTDPTNLVFPLALALPLAHIMPWLETRQRNWQKQGSERLVAWAEAGDRAEDELPAVLIRRSIVQRMGLGVTAFFLSYIAFLILFSLPLMRCRPDTFFPPVNWPFLFGIAAIGALVALRVRRVYVVFSLCALSLLLFKLF